ncbi:hypothetical protein [Citrobacter freundii]|uniref:hypothetical protein n=1 Tax=Citrobacter freundii TaxID=546 RepID=UPI0012E10420|nr:hypothetical protein [Citrobacter freundii]
MRTRLGALFFFLFCSSAMAAQDVFTATPKDNSFKFVFSGNDGVYTPSGDKTHLKCAFNKHMEGLDNVGEPYSAIIFLCPKDISMSLKFFKKSKKSFFIVTSPNIEGSGSEEVFVKQESY